MKDLLLSQLDRVQSRVNKGAYDIALVTMASLLTTLVHDFINLERDYRLHLQADCCSDRWQSEHQKEIQNEH